MQWGGGLDRGPGGPGGPGGIGAVGGPLSGLPGGMFYVCKVGFALQMCTFIPEMLCWLVQGLFNNFFSLSSLFLVNLEKQRNL